MKVDEKDGGRAVLTDENIRGAAASDSSYVKGCQYYRYGNVRSIKYFPHEKMHRAKVMGHKLYNVVIYFDSDNELDGYECDCPAFYTFEGMCKHIVAAVKSIQQNWEVDFGTEEKTIFNDATRELLDFFNKDGQIVADDKQIVPIKIIPTYHFSSLTRTKRSWLEFMIGRERMYVLKDIPQFLRAIENNQELIFGKNFTLQATGAFFDEKSKAIVEFLQAIYSDDKQLTSWSYIATSSAFNEARHVKLTNSTLLKFLEMMVEDEFSIVINNEKISQVQIVNQRPAVQLAVNEHDNGLRISMQVGDGFYGLDNNFQYIYYNNNIFKVDSLFASYIKPLVKCFVVNEKAEVHIPSTAISNFFSAMLPALEKISTVHVDEGLLNKFHTEVLEIHVNFDRYGEGISAGVVFRYGELAINPIVQESKLTIDVQGKMLLRSSSEENHLLGLFRRYGFEMIGDKFVQADEEKTYDFLQFGLPELQEFAQIFYSDDFKNNQIKNTGKVSAGVRINSKSGMLELSLYYEDIQPKELFELLSSYKLKKRYHRLGNGAFIPLDAADFKMAATLIEQLDLDAADIENKIIELPRHRAMYIDSLTREDSDFTIERSSAFKKMVQDIREPQDMEVSIPTGIQGKLRDYQKTGFKWLTSLASYGFGGILADDMGLGKTLQVITFVMSEKNIADLPSLVIAPTSLVYNWQQEVQKFASDLKVLIISGNPNERQEQLKDMDKADLIVTSYALLKRDIKFYERRTFNYCFIDEAQHIKNPSTLSAKSVKKIKAKAYFALTGTPIENTLTELWSIFDFLMPGYLQTHKMFAQKFETPIVKNKDQQALIELRRYIKPFILRRMKKTVLKELPEKIESQMINEMTKEQTTLYGAWMQQAKKEFENEIESNGFAKSQIKILSLLTRLRQVCCHPSLFIENYQGGSGKLEMLTELLEDAVAGDHRILLFSQFTGMLTIIKHELEVRNIAYHYLDGSTKAEERIKLVNSFNAGEKDVFLISLKAGGTGLNLTGADMVIHYDPWWNPAVEDQATDRAYRIGQKNAVQVFKLITKNTIEEKIYELQQKKREMIDELIKPGENFLTKMSEEDIRKLFEN